MAFQFLAAAAGFAEGAAESIEKRNKEIQRNALEEVETASKMAEEQNKRLRTKRDELRSTAEVLSSYGKFTETQIVGLLQKPTVAKLVVDRLKTAKRLDDVDFNKLYEVAEGNTDATIESTIDRMTSIPKEPAEVSRPTRAEPRGAFGLPSSAYSRTIAEGEKAAGMSMTQMRATARGVPMLTEQEQVKGTINLSQFDDPESITNIQGKLRDNMTKGIGLKDPKNASLLKQLQNNAVIKDLFDKDKGDADKPRTTAAINSVISRSLAVAVDPFVVKGVVRLVPETGDYVPIGGTVEDIAAFQKQKNETIRAQAEAIGIIDKDGKVLGGRNAEDALVPYANIKDGKIVSWKTAGKAAPAEAPATSSVTAPPAAASATPDLETPAKPILTADGKAIDGAAMAQAYRPGQKITDKKGNVKTWNGRTLQ